MSQISVQAKSLAVLLSALRQTLGKPGENPGMDGIVLYTKLADTPQGRMKVLYGVSTDAAVSARLPIVCNGELRKPIMLATRDLAWLETDLAEAVRDDKEGLVSLQIDWDNAVADLTIETSQNRDHTFPLGDISKFPLDSILSLLDSTAPEAVADSDGLELPAGNLMVIPGKYLTLVSRMEKRFSKTSPYWYRTGHPAARLLVCVGPWRAVLPGTKYPVDTDVDFPEPQVPADLHVESPDVSGGP